MARNQAQLLDLFRQLIVANELDGALGHILKFSDPDGVRSGKSGWSFGLCQFDLMNNELAATCLRACDFTPEEIHRLKHQTTDPKPLEAKLRAHEAIVRQFDEAQLHQCLMRAQGLLSKYGIAIADDAALLAIADYDNQYHLSDINKPGYLVYHLARLNRPASAIDVLRFKLDHTKYGRLCPNDCKRRYANLVTIMKEAA